MSAMSEWHADLADAGYFDEEPGEGDMPSAADLYLTQSAAPSDDVGFWPEGATGYTAAEIAAAHAGLDATERATVDAPRIAPRIAA